MKRTGWRWLAISSMVAVAFAAMAETRPQYGGTLHVATHSQPSSLDPIDTTQADSFARRSMMMLIFDTLVTVDENDRVQPSLATTWQAAPGNSRWRFTIRKDVKFSDDSLLTTELAATSLRDANPSWTVSIEGDSLAIQLDGPHPDLPAELALSRNAIAKRDGPQPLGTGPFHVGNWEPGKRLTLVASDDCWRGRPYLDSIDIELGRSYRDQMVALDSGKAELVEVPAEQQHRASNEGHNLSSSLPLELLALVFTHDANSPEEKSLRDALALSIERSSMRTVLLQGAGQATGGILPNWMTGYGFVFSTEADVPRARHMRDQVRTTPTWALGYDNGDPLSRLLAERIALNAKDAGLSLQPTSAATADVRLLRISLPSADPWVDLAEVSALVGSTQKPSGRSAEDLYAAEQAVLTNGRIIPLFHLPMSYAAAPALKNWTLRADGTWNVADAWLGSAKP